MSTEITTYEISNVDSTLTLANDLAKFIKEKKLCSNIQGKEFVNVEGWSYAGVRLGLLPITKKPVKRIFDDEAKYEYECEVELLQIATGKIIGYGFAICSNKEKSKKYFDEYAIASMAQTRAIGKAYRNTLAWVIKAAGYEPTPAEEMQDVEIDKPQQPTSGAINKTGLTENLQTYVDKNAPKQTPQAQPAKADLLTAEQSAKLTSLLSHQVFTDTYKNKVIAAMDAYTVAKAQEMIKALDDKITQWKIDNNQQ